VSIVVDASVAVAWVVEETRSAEAGRLLLSSRKLIAPAFLLVEVGNALAKRHWRGTTREGFAATAVGTLRRRNEMHFTGSNVLVGLASTLAERLRHPIYDCLYLALAQREGAALATFDDRLAQLAGKLSIPLWPSDHAA
jgi:predicted nucleic acid-binding protein